VTFSQENIKGELHSFIRHNCLPLQAYLDMFRILGFNLWLSNGNQESCMPLQYDGSAFPLHGTCSSLAPNLTARPFQLPLPAPRKLDVNAASGLVTLKHPPGPQSKLSASKRRSHSSIHISCSDACRNRATLSRLSLVQGVACGRKCSGRGL
jgi:hypothetical protein